MGLTISSLFGRLFGKKQVRILMGKSKFVLWFGKVKKSRVLTTLLFLDPFLRALTYITVVQTLDADNNVYLCDHAILTLFLLHPYASKLRSAINRR